MVPLCRKQSIVGKEQIDISKNMMGYRFSGIVFLFVQCLCCSAQILEPVKFETFQDGSFVIFKGKIEKDWHVYGTKPVEDSFGPTWAELKVNEIEGVELVGDLQAIGLEHKGIDEMFGINLSFFEDSVTFIQEIKILKNDYNLNCTLIYGVCNNENCLPPQEICFVHKDISSSQQIVSGETIVDSYSLWALLLAGMIGGLLALLTPCVWPMIPMTVSFFLKRNDNRRKAISESFIYGLSIIIIYLILGVAFTLIFGAAAMNELATNAVANIFFAFLLIVFALSFFGLFELRLPDSWSNNVDNAALSNSSSVFSIFLMALVLVIVSFSCTGPLIGVLLVTVASSGDMVAPTIGMFGFALALAVPFAIFALFPNWLKSIPKSGDWMNIVKVSLAFVELAFALKFISVADLAYGWGILPRWLFIVLWIVIFTAMSIYGVWTIVKSRRSLILKVAVAMTGLVLSIYLVFGLFGSPLKQVSAFLPPIQQNLDENHYDDYYSAIKAAKKQGKPVFVDFTGYGCVNCRKMEAAVFTNREIIRLLKEKYIVATLYVDDRRDGIGEKWSKLQQEKFGANAQPYYIIIDADENILKKPRSYDEDIDAFVDFLKIK